MNKKFLNIHALYGFAGGNPNRDESGAPKSLTVGGVERSRMSSQAMTRAKRASYEESSVADKAYRSKMVIEKIERAVIAILEAEGTAVSTEDLANIAGLATKNIARLYDGDAESKANAAAKNVVAADVADQTEVKSKSDSSDEEGASSENISKDAVVFLSLEEIDGLSQAIADAVRTGETTEEVVVKKKKKIEWKTISFINSEGKSSSLSIAAYGRMFANQPKIQCEAAVQRSHAFTTHSSAVEMDYFSVFDDMNTDHNGAAHLGFKQITSGVYYWHASIDREQLKANLMDDYNLSTERAEAFVRALVCALPEGNQSTALVAGMPDFLLVVEADAPVSLAGAFEKAVAMGSEGGYLEPSVEALMEEHARAVQFDSGTFGGAVVSGINASLAKDSDLTTVDLPKLAAKVASWMLSNE